MKRLAAPLLLLAAMAAGAEQQELDPQEVQWAMAAAKQVKACGFAWAEPFYDPEQRQVVVAVRDVVKASNRELSCAARVSLAAERPVNLPEALWPRYQAIYERLAREKDLAEARPWLAARGLLERVPRYDPARDSDDGFMRKLGKLCGIDVTGALDNSWGPRTINMEWLEKQPGQETGVECLWRAATVAGFETTMPGH